MSGQLYELAALAARYVFAALMALIVLRAARITAVDARRAAQLRRMSPETGLSGELVVTWGDEKARRGMRYPVIREGMVGSSRRADVRIRHSTVRRRHAYFQLQPEGLMLRARTGAALRDGRGQPAQELLLKDGDSLYIGSVKLLLVLSEASEPARRPERHRPRRPAQPGHTGDPDALFETDGTSEKAGKRI